MLAFACIRTRILCLFPTDLHAAGVHASMLACTPALLALLTYKNPTRAKDPDCRRRILFRELYTRGEKKRSAGRCQYRLSARDPVAAPSSVAKAFCEGGPGRAAKYTSASVWGLSGCRDDIRIDDCSGRVGRGVGRAGCRVACTSRGLVDILMWSKNYRSDRVKRMQ